MNTLMSATTLVDILPEAIRQIDFVVLEVVAINIALSAWCLFQAYRK